MSWQILELLFDLELNFFAKGNKLTASRIADDSCDVLSFNPLMMVTRIIRVFYFVSSS